MCAWIVEIRSLSPSNHPRSDHTPIVIVIQSERLKHSISPTNRSKTSRIWMFWYKQGCNWLGAIKGMAFWSRGFMRGSPFKTWPKPENAHEKSLAPRVIHSQLRWKFYSNRTRKKRLLRRLKNIGMASEKLYRNPFRRDLWFPRSSILDGRK